MVLSRRVFATRGVLLVMKTLEDERYVVIKAYKCTVSEIWRDFFVLAYIACTSYPYIAKVIKNIKNVSGCRDTRTAKSKETRGMIEHNSEVYNHPYRDLLPYIHDCTMKKDM